MKVLVDTSVWSLALRRRERLGQEQAVVDVLTELVRDLQVIMMGPIRQEILSGVSQQATFASLQSRLSVFSDHPIQTADYERAAEFYNICRRSGIQGSHVDYLICAVAYAQGFQIFTLDLDFEHYQTLLPISLFPHPGAIRLD